jgi:LysR family nitrogen assimilation transcriptional regulator
LEHGRGILHQIEVAKEELGSVRGALSGRVSIGLPPSLSKLITVALTLSFREQLAQAKLSLTEGFSVLMVESLRAGRLDMAVLYNPPPSPDLELTLLHEEALVLITGKASAAGLSKQAGVALKATMPLTSLGQLPLIVPSRPNAFRLLIETEMQRINAKPHIVLEIDGLNAILELVKKAWALPYCPPTPAQLRQCAGIQRPPHRQAPPFKSTDVGPLGQAPHDSDPPRRPKSHRGRSISALLKTTP